ncbi:hypothetical protein Dimus_008821 [Dionaea muscipula]
METTVVVSSPSAAKEVLRKSDVPFSNRIVLDVSTPTDDHDHSVVLLRVATLVEKLEEDMRHSVFAIADWSSPRTFARRRWCDLRLMLTNVAESVKP